MNDTAQTLVPAVDRAIRMLATLQDVEEGRGISDLARDLGIPKSSAHQIAATLVHHGVLERDDGTQRYRLGPGLARIAAARPTPELPELAGPYLEELAAAARMTALLGVCRDDAIVLEGKIESPAPIDISAPIGHRLDRRAGVFGKLLAAGLTPADLDRYLAKPLPVFTKQSIDSVSAYRRVLHAVRDRGYAIDVEEYLDGVCAVGSPVRGPGGEIAGGICLIGLAASFDAAALSRIGRDVCSAAESLSRDIGFELVRPPEVHVTSPLYAP